MRGVKIGPTTMEHAFDSLVEYLSREPADEADRLLLEREKETLRKGFLRIAGKVEPVPPLPPGKARIVSF